VVAFLNFLSALVWPAVLVWLILKFRTQIERSLEKLASVEAPGGFKATFQLSAPGATHVPEATIEVSQIGPDGFFTALGIRNIVSQILPKGETAKEDLLFFDNQSQHTWLAASTNKVVIVLDDENTRASNRLIQVVMDKEDVLPLDFESRGTAGVVRFGANPIQWYYSFSLFSTTDSFRDKFRELLDRSS
jgi:hypothetical protein